jgi:hypothetical protein
LFLTRKPVLKATGFYFFLLWSSCADCLSPMTVDYIEIELDNVCILYPRPGARPD